MKYIIALCLLASCTAPDTYTLGGGYGEGSIDHDNNTRGDYDTDQWIGLFTIGWTGSVARHQESLDQRERHHREVMAALDKQSLVTIATGTRSDDGGNTTTVVIPQGQVGPDVIVEVEGDIITEILTPPETLDGAIIFLLYAAGLLVLAWASTLVYRAGFLDVVLPGRFSKRKRSKHG